MPPFDKLVPLLVDAIPQAVASLKLTKPICIVRIYFYDTHAPCTYFSLRTVSVECRDQVLASKGEDAPYYIWGSGEDCGDGTVYLPPEQPSSKSDKQIAALFEQVYEFLSEDDHEEENIIEFRQFVREVAAKLNGIDWNPFCKVSDDFVVVPADGSMAFGGEDYLDLIESVPAERVELLRARGLLEGEA
jgi:hypothetical protein